MWNGYGLQDIVSDIGRILNEVLDLNLLVLIFIVLIVGTLLISFFLGEFVVLSLYENYMLETVWTILPAVVLVFLGIPRLKLLYWLELNTFFNITLKVTGLQWYWKYCYSNFNNLTIDAFLKTRENLTNGEFRLLETDNRLILPLSNVRVVVGSEDVIHSWAIPSLGVKIDANSGRLNSLQMRLKSVGLFFGQCSEICGSNHRFIPIRLEVTLLNQFSSWLKLIR